MAKAGLFDDHPSVDDMEERLTANFDAYYRPALYQNFKAWVQRCMPQEDWIRVKAMKQRKLPDVVSCTPTTISSCLAELESVLLETGIMVRKDGVPTLLADQAHRLCTTDEKGLRGFDLFVAAAI